MPLSKIEQSSVNSGVAGTGPAFSVGLSGNQTVTAGANTKVTFDTEEFDTNNNFASNKFTPTVAGYYLFTLSLQTGGGGSYIQPMIYKNGVQTRASGFIATTYSSSVTALVYMNGATDYVEGWIYTGATSVITGIDTYFQGFLARAA